MGLGFGPVSFGISFGSDTVVDLTGLRVLPFLSPFHAFLALSSFIWRVVGTNLSLRVREATVPVSLRPSFCPEGCGPSEMRSP
jgi:hypothetical protein